MNFSSKILEEAVEQLSIMPGIGKKSAFRLALFFLKKDPEVTERFTKALATLKRELKECQQCFNISDQDVCEICSDPSRDEQLLCVVEDINDVMAIEATHQFKGKYHVLGGVISPMDGIGPMDLHLDSLIDRLEKNAYQELIMALNPTLEGDTTQFYIYKRIGHINLKVSTLARGVSFGEHLEYADEMTLGRSIHQRMLYEQTVKKI
ncbi:MAG: recombination mediator RecR [Flavobacteriales bacterium]